MNGKVDNKVAVVLGAQVMVYLIFFGSLKYFYSGVTRARGSWWISCQRRPRWSPGARAATTRGTPS